MGRRKKITLHLEEKGITTWSTNSSVSARNLRKSDLGAVIFGCKNHTINECHAKLLFGLPAPHFAYVKNVSPGLPLFLFNYSDRKLHGIYEAISAGQMNIDPYGWTADSADYTPYGAQVRIKVSKKCSPLSEDEFKPLIVENYYEPRLFWFELDRTQTHRLISLFTSRTSISPSLNMTIRQTSFPISSGGQVPRKVFASLNNTDVAWGASYAAILSGKNTYIPEKESISCTERKWSSLFESSTTIGKTITKYDVASSSDVPLQRGEKELFEANNSAWASVKYDVANQSHNSLRATGNYNVESHVQAFDTSFEAHNSVWATGNNNAECQVQTFDTSFEAPTAPEEWGLPSDVKLPACYTSCEAPTASDKGHSSNLPCSDGSNDDPYGESALAEENSVCSYYSAIEGMTSAKVETLLVKLMEEVEEIKVSHQILQRELVDSKAEIRLLKAKYHRLESKQLPSMEDVDEAMTDSSNAPRH